MEAMHGGPVLEEEDIYEGCATPLSENRRRHIMVQAFAGLSYLHSTGALLQSYNFLATMDGDTGRLDRMDWMDWMNERIDGQVGV